MFNRKLIPTKQWKKRPYPATVVWAMVTLTIVAGACQMIPADEVNPTAGVIPATGISVEPTEFPPGFPTPAPEELAACLVGGGRWEVLGFSGPGCNLPTGDGGQSCTDSVDCESACLADTKDVLVADESGRLITDADLLSELNALPADRMGSCSPWVDNFGCQVWVEKGRYVEICVD